MIQSEKGAPVETKEAAPPVAIPKQSRRDSDLDKKRRAVPHMPITGKRRTVLGKRTVEADAPEDEAESKRDSKRSKPESKVHKVSPTLHCTLLY